MEMRTMKTCTHRTFKSMLVFVVINLVLACSTQESADTRSGEAPAEISNLPETMQQFSVGAPMSNIQDRLGNGWLSCPSSLPSDGQCYNGSVPYNGPTLA